MILDTNALSALADGARALEAAAVGVEAFSLPVIVLGEFRFGVLRSRHRARYDAWLSELIEASRLLLVDPDTAVHYAAVRDSLRQRGTPIPSNDAWIAALALQHGLPVLSRDMHFDAVPGVRRVAW